MRTRKLPAAKAAEDQRQDDRDDERIAQRIEIAHARHERIEPRPAPGLVDQVKQMQIKRVKPGREGHRARQSRSAQREGYSFCAPARRRTYLYCARIVGDSRAVRVVSSLRPEPRPMPVEIGSAPALRPESVCRCRRRCRYWHRARRCGKRERTASWNIQVVDVNLGLQRGLAHPAAHQACAARGCPGKPSRIHPRPASRDPADRRPSAARSAPASSAGRPGYGRNCLKILLEIDQFDPFAAHQPFARRGIERRDVDMPGFGVSLTELLGIGAVWIEPQPVRKSGPAPKGKTGDKSAMASLAFSR